MDDWTTWHARHERQRADRHGFLAITSLNFLTASPQRFPDAPGAWHTGPDGVAVDLDPGESLQFEGTTITGRHSFGVVPERGSIYPAFGDAVVEVAKRGGFDVIRPRHPSNPLLLQYTGTPVFPFDDQWVIDGRFVPFDSPRDVTVGAAVEGLEHVYSSPGRVEFNGLALTVFNGRTPGSLFALLTDQTSGVTTYAANRSLAIDPPAADGSVVLDFNRATNLPCAYTEFATCPLPPAENHLPIAVEAGEKDPHLAIVV
jgi:uncharacterized protein (DUF1684 family)